MKEVGPHRNMERRGGKRNNEREEEE